jgi:hypothetical protein
VIYDGQRRLLAALLDAAEQIEHARNHLSPDGRQQIADLSSRARHLWRRPADRRAGSNRLPRSVQPEQWDVGVTATIGLLAGRPRISGGFDENIAPAVESAQRNRARCSWVRHLLSRLNLPIHTRIGLT